ncbi:MAG: ABC transporter permease subunit, partial [Lachnospiraceae bacterium]|nr:ABC transporter permease subunit [Lachnospiraceae bacterium]
MSNEKTQKLKNNIFNSILAVACLIGVVVITLFYIIDNNKNAKSTEALNVAQEYVDAKQYDEAIEQYKAVISIDSKKMAAYTGISDTYILLSEEASANDDEVLAKSYISKANQIKALGEQVCDTTKFKNQLPIVFKSLNTGFIQTLKLFAITLAGALPLGLLISFGTRSKVKIVGGFFKFLIWIVRGTPLMLQLILIYYGPGTLGNNI